MLTLYFRIEVSTSSCGKTKIDGIAVELKTQNPVIVVELAGGVKTHTEAKLKSDTMKIYQSCIQIMEKSNGRITNTHVVLYFSKLS
jgi:hypothetical protein